MKDIKFVTAGEVVSTVAPFNAELHVGEPLTFDKKSFVISGITETDRKSVV